MGFEGGVRTNQGDRSRGIRSVDQVDRDDAIGNGLDVGVTGSGARFRGNFRRQLGNFEAVARVCKPFRTRMDAAGLGIDRLDSQRPIAILNLRVYHPSYGHSNQFTIVLSR